MSIITSQPGSTTNVNDSQRRMTMRKTPTMNRNISGEKDPNALGNFAKDMQSFDLLWYDLVTKTRLMIQEVCGPLIDKIAVQEDLLNQQSKHNESYLEQIERLNSAVFKRGPKMTMFDQINQQITDLVNRYIFFINNNEQQDHERKREINRLQNSIEKLQQSMDGQNQKLSQQDQQIHTIQMHSDNAVEELDKMKITSQEQSENFIDKLTQTCQDMLSEIEQVRKKITELDITVHFKTSSVQSLDNNVQEIFKRLSSAEQIIEYLQKSDIDMKAHKCDKDIFDNETKKMKEDIRKLIQDHTSAMNQNQTLENYIEKYQNIRIQTLVKDTLNACVGAKERKRLEIYDTEKMSLYYKIVLEDHGIPNIQRLIIQLNEKARKDLEEEDRRQLHRIQAQNTQNQNSRPSSELTVPNKTAIPNSSKLGKIKESYENSDDESIIIDTIEEDHHNYSINQFVDERFDYNLIDLVSSDFAISPDDRDFELNQAQIIKVLKIFLYKMNLVMNKVAYEKGELRKNLDEYKLKQDQLLRSQIEESNQFLQSIHLDFETYLKKHKREHSDLNQKLNNFLDLSKENSDQMSDFRNAIESYATILSCLLEYNNVEQSLSLQDESDRQNISMVGQQMKNKGERLQNNFPHQQSATNVNPNQTQVSFKSTYRTKGSFNINNNNSTQQQFKTINNNAGTQEDMLYLSQRETNINNLNVSLDQSCLSCSGAPSQVLQTFKIACLSYQPSKVNYRKEVFNRLTLMQMRSALLQKCEQIINELQWPFIAKGLKTSKVFNDLVSFFNDRNFNSSGLKDSNPSPEQMQTSLYVEGGGMNLDTKNQTKQSPFLQSSVLSQGLHLRQLSDVERGRKLLNLKQGSRQQTMLSDQQRIQSTYKSAQGSALGKSRNNASELGNRDTSQAVTKQTTLQQWRDHSATPVINLPVINMPH